MTPQTTSTRTMPERLHGWGEWLLVTGLAIMLGWTTLSLGGYLAETMVVTSRMVFGLAALGGILGTLGRGRGFNRAALLPVPFLIYALASVVWIAPAPWLAWREWLLWLQMWLVFVLVLHFGRGRRHTWVLVGTFVLLGLAGVAMAAYQRYGDANWMMLGRTQAEQFEGRSAGMFGIPNSLAGLLELMIPACLALVFARSGRPVVKVACGWLAGLFFFAVVLTGSRGGWISLALVLLLWPLIGGQGWRRRLAGTAVILAIAVGGFWALYRFSEYARGRIQPFLDGRFESSRPIIWKAGLQIWRGHPWTGSGAASYNVLFDQHRPKGFINEPDWTHNDYLNTLSDYGLVGFLLWSGAGVALLGLGWRAVQRARRTPAPGGSFGRWSWKFGLWLGLLAFALHLAVDFHTKIPALAFLAAMLAAMLVRDEEAWIGPGVLRPWLRAGIALGLIATVVSAWRRADPLYRAEALRYEPRREINRLGARGAGELAPVVMPALTAFRAATKIDPRNGQAWADQSYATALSWLVHRQNQGILGQQAEQMALRAVGQCPLIAEYWVRLGVARDMQGRRGDAEGSFHRALKLAPHNSEYWFYLAFHHAVSREDERQAWAALETCLSLDPSNPQGLALREQLKTGTFQN